MNPFDPTDQLIAYVEGQLPPDQREAFERKLQADPALQHQLQLMQRIDESLQHTFAPPGFVNIDLNAARASGAAAGGMGRWLRLAGVAIAASVLLAVGMYYFQHSQTAPARERLTPVAMYEGEVNRGFIPEWACKDDAEFIDTTQKAFGLPLLAQSDATVQIVGWTYSSRLNELGLSKDARAILARVDGTPVLLLLDKTGAGRGPRVGADGKLKVFKKDVSGVTIYEITPLATAAATEKFHLQR